jgi:hypothetical protein
MHKVMRWMKSSRTWVEVYRTSDKAEAEAYAQEQGHMLGNKYEVRRV